MICLNESHSTAGLLTAEKRDQREVPLSNRGLKYEGGVRVRGYYKQSLRDKPLVTIITPTFNRKEYLEETIQREINQAYENVEHIIIDGASTDDMLDVIKKYNDKIDYWLSKPDNSMYEAINKDIVDFTKSFHGSDLVYHKED